MTAEERGPLAGAGGGQLNGGAVDLMWAFARFAGLAELADAPALGAGGRKAVGVRVPYPARRVRTVQQHPRIPRTYAGFFISPTVRNPKIPACPTASVAIA
jgi:hypothetical protein